MRMTVDDADVNKKRDQDNRKKCNPSPKRIFHKVKSKKAKVKSRKLYSTETRAENEIGQFFTFYFLLFT
jgi:hypothetical protein